MKCEMCGSQMTTAIENYRYTESGLSFVTLTGVEVRRCGQCGEEEVVIPRIEDLHRAIALSVIRRSPHFKPEEIKFLRKYLGWSGADYARRMGVTSETVSRWEKGVLPMGTTADRALRLAVAVGFPTRDYSLDTLATLKDQPSPYRLGLQSVTDGWVELPMAA